MLDLVSIIMPVYNSDKYIEESIKSVIAQTYKNWELILIDDCSKDGSLEIVKKISENESRIKLILNDKNKGPAISRNEGIKIAKGRFIAFLDSDDVWLPEKLEKQIQLMKAKNAVMSYTLFKRMSADGKKLGDVVNAPISLNYEDSLKNTAMGTSTVVIDKKISGNFEVKNVPCDDFFLWNEILKRGNCAFGLMEVMVHYRVLNNSYSRNKLKYAQKVWETYKLMNLGIVKTYWCFLNYAFRALIKYRKF